VYAAQSGLIERSTVSCTETNGSHSLFEQYVSRTLDTNLPEGCFGCQFGRFSARPLNGRLDISSSSWRNSRVFEDWSLDYFKNKKH